MTPVAPADALLTDVVDTFKSVGRIVIVGASLAGLRAAEALRDEGFNGSLTIIGDEPHEPYDTATVEARADGWVAADDTKLPRMRDIDARVATRRRRRGAGPGQRAGAPRQWGQGPVRPDADRDRHPRAALVQP